MRIAIVTDAWEPQVNGVVRTLQSVKRVLEAQGHQVRVISPDLFYSVPCPTYPEIRLAMVRSRTIGDLLDEFSPHAVHLATEGPVCVAARRWCLRHDFPFTTAYHTQFPDYVEARSGVPAEWVWRYIRWFHAPAQSILASTASIRQALVDHGLTQIRHWGRGVDLANFHPGVTKHPAMADLPGPVQLYVGRVAVEKNLEAFLASGHPGTKVVVGDGPARAALAAKYPDAKFLGPMFGEELAQAYRAADVFVFPSKTDTFGLVMIEALACGTPVAGYPVTGPVDILTPETGAMADDLDVAIGEALTRDRDACAAYGRSFTWEASAAQFLGALVPIIEEARAA
ncbi:MULTISPECIES: glycosyltransferase family 4 protein [unclassified Sphingomonas]|uniref:glycosyltransferase family 4 protein n=1 Tax=unclassified Sphingomonas TaxID=196159 RepID=UPI00215145F7|nr:MULTISPECIES: glycosyltransferase family 1 protein [unclassified Sphingomonas]MCR5871406.1 glycosyltransferase family 1 protein [Sphingomonas sp. J344]UUY01366.1 glycosyltransferase family 1 protein [Sphingomonas sp. J315]